MATLDTARNYSPTFLGLVTQLGISCSISLYCLLQFEWNRRKSSMQYLYTPRTRLSRDASPPIPSGLFSWVHTTILLREEFYLKHVGLDAVMYLRFLKMAVIFLLCNVLVVGSILIPINYNGGGIEIGVQRASINNLTDSRENYLWAHAVCTYFVSVSWMYLLYKNYYDYVMMRKEHFINEVRAGSVNVRTIMVSRIPEELKSEVKLKHFFESLGLGPVESTRIVRHTGKLDRKIVRRENALLALEKAHIQLAKNVAAAILMRRLYLRGMSLWQRWFKRSADNVTPENTPELHLEAGDIREHQRLQSVVCRMKRRKTMPCEIVNEREADQNHVKPSISASVVASSSLMPEELFDEEDGYGRSMLIWDVLDQLPKESLDGYQPTHRKGRYSTGHVVYSIDHFLKQFNRLDRRIAELRARNIYDEPYKPTSTGFVTFVKHTTAAMAAQSIACSEPHTCTTKMAPEPRDILWDNITKPFKERMVRLAVVNVLVWALTIFWLFPIVAFLGLTTIDNLSKRMKLLKTFLDASPMIRNLLQNVLPSVLVTTFMAMLPWILMEVSKYEAFPSYSELEEAVLKRYYYFSFFNVFIVFLLGTAFVRSIFDAIQNPTSIVQILARGLPQGATFFINYVIFTTCTHGLELLQVGSQLFLHILLTSQFVATTPRMLQRVTIPWNFQFYYYYPNHILILVITITYSVINPLILVFALLYYSVALLVFKHQFAYCYVRRYEAAGKFYRQVFRYTSDGLLIFQLTMIGLIWLRESIAIGAFLLPLLVGTAYFKYYCHKTFHSRTHYMALDTGLELQTEKESALQRSERRTPEEVRFANVDEKTGNRESEDLALVMTSATLQQDENRAESRDIRSAEKTMQDNLHITEKHSAARELDSIDSAGTAGKGEVEAGEKVVSAGSPKGSVEQTRSSLDRQHVKHSQSDASVLKTLGERKSKADHGPLLHDSVPTHSQSTLVGVMLPGINSQATDETSTQGAPSKLQTKATAIEGTSGELIPPKLTLKTSFFEPNKSVGSDVQVRSPGTAGSTVGFAIAHSHENRQPSQYSTGRNSATLRANLHLAHDPNRKELFDNTSEYQTYLHPNLVKALNRKLWLPRNPFKKITVEDTIELEKALTSSEGGLGMVGYMGGASGFLGEALVTPHDTGPNPVFPFTERAAGGGDDGCERLRRRSSMDIGHRSGDSGEEGPAYRGCPEEPDEAHEQLDEVSSGEEY